ncbi:MAG: outer membrane protein assembly factor BamD [Rikenellaceae bacterium]|jgi:outer membrane protein assembly factor BamD
MKRAKVILLIVTCLVLTASCKSSYEALLNSTDTQQKYKGAMTYFDKGKYYKAAQLFEQLLLYVKGTDQDDTVQFYLGLSNYKYGDYIKAEANFNEFVSVFPRSPFTEEAKFLRIECLYNGTYRYELDQTPTFRTMAAINEYLYEYPNTTNLRRCRDMLVDLQERLDRKSYEAAKLYYTLEDYKAASYALKNTLKENADNQYREDIMYYIVCSNYQYAVNSIPEKQKERFMVLIDDYYNFISEFPESKYRKELDGMFAEAQKITNKN